MSTPIHHIFAPHVDGPFLRKALSLFFVPWRWRLGDAGNALRTELRRRYGKDVYLFATGREALFALLKAHNFPASDEVIVQAYTCVVVPNAIRAAGLVPVYADIEAETLNLDPEDVARRITPKTRAVICQHTFGIPAPLARLRALCSERGILLIEDCAHVLPDIRGPEGMMQAGDAAFLSFGRDKAISGVSGGAVLCSTSRSAEVLRSLERHAKPLSSITIKLLLLYPLIYALAKPVYSTLGRPFLALCGRIGLLVPILRRREKGGMQEPVVYGLPNACAALALFSLQRLEAINDHRRALTALYCKESADRGWPMLPSISPTLPLQKFPLFTPNAEGIRQKLKSNNIHLHDGWTGCVVCPASVDAEHAGYRDGDDPEAEMVGTQILCLPTHPTMTTEQARKLISALDPLLP